MNKTRESEKATTLQQSQRIHVRADNECMGPGRACPPSHFPLDTPVAFVDHWLQSFRGGVVSMKSQGQLHQLWPLVQDPFHLFFFHLPTLSIKQEHLNDLECLQLTQPGLEIRIEDPWFVLIHEAGCPNIDVFQSCHPRQLFKDLLIPTSTDRPWKINIRF